MCNYKITYFPHKICSFVGFQNSVSVSLTAAENEAMPSNCLVVNGAKGAWTISNRDLAMALYESWRRAHLLRSQGRSHSIVSKCQHIPLAST